MSNMRPSIQPNARLAGSSAIGHINDNNNLSRNTFEQQRGVSFSKNNESMTKIEKEGRIDSPPAMTGIVSREAFTVAA